MKSYFNINILKQADKYGPKAREVIKQKMKKMKYEDMSQEQKAAIAIEEARRKGLKVPSKKSCFNKDIYIYDILFKIAAIEEPKKALEKMAEYAEQLIYQFKHTGLKQAAEDFLEIKDEIDKLFHMNPTESMIKHLRQKFMNLMFKHNEDIKKTEKYWRN